MMELELNLPGLTVWAGNSSARLIGLFFFNTTVTAECYLQILKKQFLPIIAYFDLNNVYFQEDKAPAHFGRYVRAWLDDFP